VIASQAVISGAYSVSLQAVRLGFMPRLTIRHTSEHEIGQIYVPAVNMALFAAVVVLVLGFRSSERLAAAYGIAVSGTFLITTVLFLTVARRRWHWPPWLIGLLALAFAPLELAFFAANLGKIHHGGWLPLVIAISVFTVMTTWHRGREIVTANRRAEEGSLQAFVDRLRIAEPPVLRVPGTAVFPSPSRDTTPLALRANVHYNHVLHDRAVIITIESANVPHVTRKERVVVDPLGYTDDNIVHVTARFGFQDQPDALRLARAKGLECDIDVDHPIYFLSRITIEVTPARGMSRWRKKLFLAVSRHAASPVAHFGLPEDRTVSVSSQIRV